MKLQNPYKGLFPYSSEDEDNFFGRSKEVRDLLEMIKTSQLVILFGESGTGKTSLINAKLFPELIRQYYLPIYIRLNYLGKTPALQQIREAITAQLRQWDKHVPEFTHNQTLIEYASMTNVFNGLVKPILFFDQFEEYFTLGAKYVPNEVLEELITQISDLIELRIPGKKRQMVPAGMDDESMSNEELTVNALRFTVVFSLRQDFIGQLEDLKIKIPSINTGRYRIKKFDYAQARESIVQSAQKYAAEQKINSVLEEDAAQQMIRQLQAMEQEQSAASDTRFYTSTLWSMMKVGFREIFRRNKTSSISDLPLAPTDTRKISIDPTVLSLYCYQLYEKAKKKTGVITTALVNDASCNSLIKEYYHTSLPEKKYKEAIESTLITPDGRRVLKDLAVFSRQSGISESEAEVIRDKTAIIRIYGDLDPRQVELAHDQIAKQALISKNTRSAESIKRNALYLLMIAGILIALAFVLTWVFVNAQKNNNDLSVQKARVAELEAYLQRETQAGAIAADSIKRLNAQYNAVLLQGNKLITDQDDINAEIRNLKAQLNKSIYAGRSQTAQVLQLNTTNDALEKENANVRYQLEVLQTRNRRLTDSLNIAQAQIRTLNAELADFRGNIKSSNDQLKRPVIQEKKQTAAPATRYPASEKTKKQ